MYKELLHINNKGQDLNSLFTKGNIQMANKHEIPLISREMQLEHTINWYYTLTRMT